MAIHVFLGACRRCLLPDGALPLSPACSSCEPRVPPPRPQPGRRLEFVVNDGGNDWDKPSPWAGSKLSNYVVEEPGTYRLRNGKVTRLA